MDKYLNELELEYYEVVEKINDFGFKGGGVSDMPRGGKDPYALEKLIDKKNRLKKQINQTNKEIVQQVETALAYLAQEKNEKIEKVYVLKQIHSFSWYDISKQLGISQEAARKRYERFIKQLDKMSDV